MISGAAMQRLEAEAFRTGVLVSRDAMEIAGRGVAQVVLDLMVPEGRALCAPAGRALRAPECRASRALVLCGTGNNGGDGYVVARRLCQAGWTVQVLALGVPATNDARYMWTSWRALGPVDPLADGLTEVMDPDVVVDALFGIGLSRPITGALAVMFDQIKARWPLADVPRVAVDLPSGVNADTGAAMGAVLPATVSVTFHLPKPAHLCRADLCGEVKVVDIGL